VAIAINCLWVISRLLAVEWRLLEGVPADQVRELLQIARRRTFARNEVVFHRDDPGDSLHLIRKGRFAVRGMTPLGDVATIAIRAPGESFGEMALIADEARRSATVAALEDAGRSPSIGTSSTSSDIVIRR
jgi:CRP-like cAMP-binding protein